MDVADRPSHIGMTPKDRSPLRRNAHWSLSVRHPHRSRDNPILKAARPPYCVKEESDLTTRFFVDVASVAQDFAAAGSAQLLGMTRHRIVVLPGSSPSASSLKVSKVVNASEKARAIWFCEWNLIFDRASSTLVASPPRQVVKATSTGACTAENIRGHFALPSGVSIASR